MVELKPRKRGRDKELSNSFNKMHTSILTFICLPMLILLLITLVFRQVMEPLSVQPREILQIQTVIFEKSVLSIFSIRLISDK